ncbi:hypothetical protein ACFYY8_41000 [Streptosporangium sp. NPDC001559]|uniref:hypothetical protein n=1 Tax=Streptosporangium sp. NPDC001559 TaxID=3366187 RepID=UPI0036EA3831
MRRITTAVAVTLLGFVALACTAACGADEVRRPLAQTLSPEDAEPVSHEVPQESGVYVINLYGAEEGEPARRPANLVASEFSTLKGITWRSWGPEEAVGGGRLSGTWCLPGCQARPYEATITLSKARKVGGRRYFTKFDITGDFPRPDSPKDTLSGTLPLPFSTP